jgi:Flp pilus assembly protein TadD
MFKLTIRNSENRHHPVATAPGSNPSTRRKVRRSGVLFASLFLAITMSTVTAQTPATTAGKARPRTAVNTHAKAPAGSEVDQLLAMGQDAHEAGRYEEAIAAYNRVISLSKNQPRAAAVANFLIGNVNMSQKRFGNAEIAYQKSIALNPSHADSTTWAKRWAS